MSRTWRRTGGALAALLFLLSLASEARAEANDIVVVMLDEASRGAASRALATEIAGRQARIFATDAPSGETEEDHSAAALWLAREVGAVAALWVETDRRGRHRVMAALARDGELRDAPLPSPPASLEPRVFAIIAATLIDELLEPAADARPVEVEAVDVEIPILPMPPVRRGGARASSARPRPSWLELGVEVDASARSFHVPIDPACDTSNRAEASFESAFYPEMGARLAFYPGALFTSRWAAGIGVDASFHHHVQLTVVNTRRGSEVEASQWSLGLGLRYRAVLGTESRGVTLIPRVGYHRYVFFLGDLGNDIVPPFTYQSITLGLNVEVPLGTRWVALDLGGHWLGVVDIGAEATAAYNASGQLPDANGFRFTAGLGGPIFRGLRWYVGLDLLGHYSTHRGKGQGWGVEPTTECVGDCVSFPGCVNTSSPDREPVVGGIYTTGRAVDHHWRVMFGFSYRFSRRGR